MHRIDLPDFILISGSGKKVGKTYLAVGLIAYFSPTEPIVALKISPHTHDDVGKSMMVEGNCRFTIYRDLEPHDRNSGQYLKAGARASYFMEVRDEHLPEALQVFLQLCNPAGKRVICESGALGRLFRPSVMIFIAPAEEELSGVKQQSAEVADIRLPACAFRISEAIEKLQLFLKVEIK